MIAENKTALGIETPEGRERLARLFRDAQVVRCIHSVTHDVNNSLGAIMAYAELIGMESNLDTEMSRMLGEIVSSVKRCSDLVTGLSSISRRDTRPDIQLVVMSDLVQRTLDLRAHEIRAAHIQLETQLDSVGEYLVVDKPRIEHALLYLISNSIEALDGESRKKIRLTLSRDEIAFRVGIWDSSPPLPKEVRSRMFEPFTTTKGGDHLGLGLYLASETSRAHAGDLTYDQETGFTLRLAINNGLVAS